MAERQVTLIVLQHGLWGNKNHMNFIQDRLRETHADDNIDILNVDVNESEYTYDGIDICGKRLAVKIQAHVIELRNSSKKRVTKISMVGYSLGGLIIRYALGVLGKAGFFKTIEPIQFVTFATPHMGVRRPSTSVLSNIFNFLCGRMVSRSGEQLQLIDKYENNQPLLSVMADPDREFYEYLSKFNVRRTYANVINDRTVPYWTAALDTTNYFDTPRKLNISLDDSYPSLITGFGLSPKPRSRKFPVLLIVCSPIIIPLCIIAVPILLIAIFLYIGYQGTRSRIRVSRLLEAQTKHPLMDNVMLDTVETIHIPDNDDSMTVDPEKSPKTDHGSLYNPTPSDDLIASTNSLALASAQLEIQKNLCQLDWQKVLVHIRGMNAHGSIVCREKRFSNDGGRAVIQHFVDTIC